MLGGSAGGIFNFLMSRIGRIQDSPLRKTAHRIISGLGENKKYLDRINTLEVM